MGLFDEVFGGGQRAGFRKAQDTLERQQEATRQAVSQAQGGLAPFQHIGTQAQQQLLKSLMGLRDPQAVLAQALKGYQLSPEAQFQMQQGTRAAGAATEASGLLGSGAEQKGLEQFGQGVAGQDVQRYLGNLAGIGRTFLGGLSGLGGQGLQAAGEAGQFGLQGAGLESQMAQQIAGARFGGETARAGALNKALGLTAAGLIQGGSPLAQRAFMGWGGATPGLAAGGAGAAGAAGGAAGGGAAAGAAGAAGGAGGLASLAALFA